MSSSLPALAPAAADSLNVLLLASSPIDLRPALNLAEEVARLADAVRRAPVPIRLRVVAPPTLQQLEQELSSTALERFRPHVLHFLGHGEEDGLWFEKKDGSAERIPTSRFCRLLSGASVRLALINACLSATTRAQSICKQLVEAGVRAAIGHGLPVADRSAIVFAQRFYELLLQGQSVGLACRRAANHLVESGLPGAGEIEVHGDEDLLLAGQMPAAGPGRVEDEGLARGYLPGAGYFFGRAEEYLQISRSLDQTDLCAFGIWGVGGIGKTRLAVEVARRNAWCYRDGGVAFVDALEVSEKTTRGMFQLALARLVPGADEGTDPIAGLVRSMSRAPALLVLDNLETLPDDEHKLLARNLTRLPRNGSRVLLTARAPLAAVEELPDARSLTLTRGLDDWNGAHYAHRIASNRKVAVLDVVPEVRGSRVEGPCAALSRRVSGHPKMIELAVSVARKGREALDEALANLGGSLDEQLQSLLETGLRYVGPEGLRLLPYLVLFPTGQLMPEAMRAVAATQGTEGEDPEEDEAAARTLVDKGLDQLERGGYLAFEQEKNIYTFHPTLLDFVRRRQTLSEEERNARAAMLLVFYAGYLRANVENYPAIDRCFTDALHWMEAAWRDRQGPGPVDAFLVTMIDALGHYFERRGFWHSGEQWHERLIDLLTTSAGVRNEALRGRALYRQGMLLYHRGKIEAARSALKASLRASEDFGDQRGQGASLYQLALIEYDKGNLAEAHHLLQRVLTIPEDTSCQQRQAAVLHQLAVIELSQGNPFEARRLLECSLKIREDLGDQGGQATSLHVLAKVELSQGNPSEARRLLQRSLQIDEHHGDQQGVATSLHQLATIEHLQGNPAEARRLLHRSMTIHKDLGDQRGQSASLHQLAIIEHNQGDSAKARRLLYSSRKIREALGDQHGLAASLHELAIVEHDQRNPPEARRLLRRSLKIREAIGDQHGLAGSMHVLAMVEYSVGSTAEARSLLHRALKILKDLGDLQGQAASLHLLAMIELEEGNPAEARRLWEHSLTIKETIGDIAGQAGTLCMLAQRDASDGAFELARTKARRAVQLLEGIGSAEAALIRSILAEYEGGAGGGNAGTEADVAGWMPLLQRVRTSRPTEVVPQLDQELAEATQADQPGRQVALCLARSLALWRGGDIAGCDDALQAAEQALARVTGAERESLTQLCTRFKAQRASAGAGKIGSFRLYEEAKARLQTRQYPQALALLEQALAASIQEKHQQNQATCLLTLGQVLMMLERPAEAHRHLREGLAIATDLGEPTLLRKMQEAMVAAARAQAIEENLQRPLDEVLDEAGCDENKANVLLVRANGLANRGAAEATDLIDQSLGFARRANAPRLLIAGHHLLAVLAARDGRPAEARQQLAEALRLAEEAKLHDEAGELTRLLAHLEPPTD